jgi:hypothetical protein
MMEFTRATIEGISGHPMSGLWMLMLSTGPVHIESGTGVRALAAAFGATEGSGDLLEKITGKDIVFSVDFLNVMEGFTPYESWEHGEIEMGETITVEVQ